ncbi:multidrug efflux pump subunit AcrB [Bradyrhizobium sp. USDA 4353]
MPSFFIDRPIFAWVVALFICLIGAIAIPLLAVAQYPIIAPPSISISTSYPGASPENLYNSVTRLIEEELNGASGILNFESTSDSLGQVEITANFVPGTSTNDASVEVQNRLKRVEARLPARRHPAGHPGRGSLRRGAADHHPAIDRRQPRRGRPRRFHDPQRAR